MTKPFRNGVIAVITRSDGKILVGNRFGKDKAWQLPQGGMDKDELPGQAIMRELLEEIGSNHFKIIQELQEPITYKFPSEIKSKITKKYSGQSMHWFVLKCEEPSKINLENAVDQEFDKLSWFTPSEILSNIVSWKLDFYKQGFQELGIQV